MTNTPKAHPKPSLAKARPVTELVPDLYPALSVQIPGRADQNNLGYVTMSYMKSGRAQKWTTCVFCWEQQAENADQPKFLDWEDFTTTFRTEFTSAQSDTLAINHLELTAYYQKAHPLDEYIDEFQDLVADSGYSDPKTIVVKFQRGLNAQIQNSITTMASGRPSDANLEAWYTMAQVVDQN